jgi:DNA-binding beta-propeller fold protein YncE
MPVAVTVVCVAIVIHQKIKLGATVVKFISHLAVLLCLTASIMLNSCVPASPPAEPVDLTSAGYLTLFLNNSAQENRLNLTISNVEIYTEPLWYPLTAPSNPSNDGTLAQHLIAAAPLLVGNYERIRFQLTITDLAGTLLRQQQTELPLQHPLEIKQGSSSALFLNSNLTPQDLSQPLEQQLSLWGQQQPLADELLYILCPNIQTVYVARVEPCQIIAAYGVGNDIADMVIDNERQLLYLLNRHQRLIQRFDTVSQTMTDRIPLPLTDRPGGIGIDVNGDTLYVTDAVNRQLLQIAADNGTLQQQLIIGYQPGTPYPFDHEYQSYLALLSKRDQQLVVVQTETLTPLYSINAGQQPNDIVYANQALFVSDTFGQQLLQIAPETGKIQARISTNSMPSSIIADPTNNNLLIALADEHKIAFLPFGQQLVARYTTISGAPSELAIAQQRRLLFATTPKQNRVSVIDLPSERQINSICVAGTPTAIAFQEP